MAADKLRIGAVNYLNTKPLVYGLEGLAPHAEVIFDLPSRLADGLAVGRFDVALIPSVEFFQSSDYTIVSDACIGCRGPVLSVKLFCRVPAHQIERLALDEGSRTSVALVRILLMQRYGIEPRLGPLAIGAGMDDTDADAVLLIGDGPFIRRPADLPRSGTWGTSGAAGRSCRSCLQCGRRERASRLGDVEVALAQARDLGVAHIDQIAAAEAAPLGLTVPQCTAYLRDHLHFYLGPREQRGLKLFHERAVEMGLAPADESATAWQTPLRTHDHVTIGSASAKQCDVAHQRRTA